VDINSLDILCRWIRLSCFSISIFHDPMSSVHVPGLDRPVTEDFLLEMFLNAEVVLWCLQILESTIPSYVRLCKSTSFLFCLLIDSCMSECCLVS
jgi:hypothetical protein